MSYNPSLLKSASFMPGLQNNGTFRTSVTITGVLPAGGSSGTSNMVGYFTIDLPDNTVIASMRVNVPTAADDLADKWFPLVGTLVLINNSSPYYLINLMSLNSSSGRQISFNIINLLTNPAIDFNSSPMTINIYGHLYTIPW